MHILPNFTAEIHLKIKFIARGYAPANAEQSPNAPQKNEPPKECGPPGPRNNHQPSPAAAARRLALVRAAGTAARLAVVGEMMVVPC